MISIFLLFPMLFSMNLRMEKEIDLSFFLKPHKPHEIFLTVDTQDNILLTQLRKDTFIKIDQKGRILYQAPLKLEGEILNFDIDIYDNPVCLFSPRKKGGYFFLPLMWFDAKTGKRIKEINLGETFDFVANINMLNPYDLILINGTIKDKKNKNKLLHIVDFNAKILKSFSSIENLDTSEKMITKNLEYFAVRPKIDRINQRILQTLPSTDLIKIFNYSGEHIDDIKWNKKIFFIRTGDLWLKENNSYVIFKNIGKKYAKTEIKIPAVKWHFLAEDISGKLYFIGGEEFQSLKIYK